MPITLEQLVGDNKAWLYGRSEHFRSKLWRVSSQALAGHSEHASSNTLTSGTSLSIPDVYIASTEVGDRLLLDRRLSGRSKVRLLATVGRHIMYLLKDSGLLKAFWDPNDLVIEVCMERGGGPFELGIDWPWEGIHTQEPVFRAHFAVERSLTDSGDEKKWQAKVVPVKPFEQLWRPAQFLLCPQDCSASGASRVHLLDFITHRDRELSGGTLKKVLVVDACGSGLGISRCHKLCQSLGLEAIYVMSSAIMDVTQTVGFSGAKETDLPLLGEYTIAPRVVLQAAEAVYQGKKLCAVGDMTSSLFYPLLYIFLTLEEMMRAGWDCGQERENLAAWEPNPWGSPRFRHWLANEAQKVLATTKDGHGQTIDPAERVRRTLDYFGIEVPAWARSA